MISINVPGWRNLMLDTLLCDFNGTLATDGILSDVVKEKLTSLAKEIRIVVITSDTNGTVREELKDLPIEVEIIEKGTEAMSKRFLLDKFGSMSTAFMGNGANDEKIMGASAFSVCVIGNEGAFVKAINNAHIVVYKPEDALDLFLKPTRVVSGLRR